MKSLFKRRLRPSKLPHPILDGFVATFLQGFGAGAVIALGAVVFVASSMGRL